MDKKSLMSLGLLSAMCICACSTAPAYRTVALPDGKAIKIIGVIPIHYSSGESSLMLKYQTDLKVDDTVALRREADDIWSSFQTEAEKAQVRSAIISANEVPVGKIFKQSRGYNFVYSKDAEGSWHCANDGK